MKNMCELFEQIYRCRKCGEIVDLIKIPWHTCKVDTKKEQELEKKLCESCQNDVKTCNPVNTLGYVKSPGINIMTSCSAYKEKKPEMKIHYYERAEHFVKDFMGGNQLPVGAVVIFRLYSDETKSVVYNLEVVGSKVIGSFLNKSDAEKCGELYL